MRPWSLIVALSTVAGASAAEPVQLSVIPGQGPARHAPCGGAAAAEFCVQPGPWLGVCRPAVGKMDRKLVAGELTLDPDGQVHFSGCSDYSALIALRLAEQRGYGAEKAVFPQAGCIVPGEPTQLMGFAMPAQGLFVALDATGSLSVVREEKPTAQEALCARVGASGVQGAARLPLPPLPAGLVATTGWTGQLLGDLDGDGAPELLLSAPVAGQREVQVTLLVSAGATVDSVALGVSRPTLARTAAQQLLEQVQAALEECQHWADEEPTDAARAQEIKRGAERSCGAYRKLRKRALRRFPHDAALGALPEAP